MNRIRIFLLISVILIVGIFIYKSSTGNITRQPPSHFEHTQKQADTRQYKTIHFMLNDAAGKKYKYSVIIPSTASYKIYPKETTNNKVALSIIDIKLNPNTTLTIDQGLSDIDKHEHKLNLNFVAVLHEQLGMLYLVKNEPTQNRKDTVYTYTNNLKLKDFCTNTTDGKNVEAPCGTTIVTNKDRSYSAYFACKLQQDNQDDMNLCNNVIVGLQITEN